MMERVDNVIAIIGMDLDSNTYVFDDVIVDPGTGRNINYLADSLKEAGKSFDDFNRIVNTHCHFDHVGGDEYLQKEYGLEVYMHEGDAKFIENEDGDTTVSTSFGSRVPDININKLKEGDMINDFKVLNTPGHTIGGICLYDGKSLIAGDTVFFNGSFGRSDYPTGNTDEMKKSLARLAQLDVKNLFTGHGPYIVGEGNRHVKLSSDNANKWY